MVISPLRRGLSLGHPFKKISLRSEMPWIIGGVFNEILSNNEKFGGLNRANWQMQNFCMCIDDCQLLDRGFSGYEFT